MATLVFALHLKEMISGYIVGNFEELTWHLFACSFLKFTEGFEKGFACVRFILPNWLGNVVVELAETTYYKDKVYLPREVQEKLGLVDGDKLYIEVLGRGVARLVVVRGSDAGKRVLERLDNPPNLGKLMGRITREEIYEDIT